MSGFREPEKYIAKVTDWASSCVNIVALALVGSYARNQSRPDSDIDFVLICDDPLHLLNNLSWIEQFGKVTTYKLEDWGTITTVRVVYADGQEVEFGIAPGSWADVPVDGGTYQVVTDGMLILADKRDVLEKLENAVMKGKAG